MGDRLAYGLGALGDVATLSLASPHWQLQGEA